MDPTNPGMPGAEGATNEPQTQQFSGSGGGSRREGGGASGKSLDECMATWDSSTHMSKELWRTTCEQSLREYPKVSVPGMPSAETK
jgi:hypothetical protein